MPVIARHFRTGEPLRIDYDTERILSVIHTKEPPLGWVAPAFFDIQINGGLGISFNSLHLTTGCVQQVTMLVQHHGIGQYLPTLITGSFEALRHGFHTLALARSRDKGLAQAIPGYHLEGPYLSDEDGPRGAHPREHIRNPDWAEFQQWQEAAEGKIRLVTLAPERKGAIAFIDRLVSQGITVAIGHTAATPEQLRDAVHAGAKLSTHLGNGSHAVLPRHHNYIWEQLANDQLWASIISDGHHLPTTVLKCILRAKTPERIVITSDASSLAGLPAGKYQHWDHELEILPSGKIVVPGTPFLAGSGQFTDACIAEVLKHNLLTLPQAIDAVTVQPAKLLGLPIPTMEAGPRHRLVHFQWDGNRFQVNRLI
jgi:N-acetylglucosamine-6-phosphate deacetylase